MEDFDQSPTDALDQYAALFRAQLESLLNECARGRRGLFADPVDEQEPWQEAVQLRQLAMALQQLFAQDERQNLLADEFLDLCTMHGESHPGESRLARAFLARIEKGEVGTQPEGDRRPW